MSAALAQSIREPVPADDLHELEEILVTAQHRSERLQDVPLSVTALSAHELENLGVADTNSLSQAVPGLSYTLGANSATPFIRGVGTTTNSVGSEASVATYMDDVYVGSINAQLLELNNIERIEILKGPQGTLFGRNATGGVIQIVTVDPNFAPAIEVNLGRENYDATRVSLYATTGLTQSVAVDLAAYGTNQGAGWGRNLETDQPTFTRHQFGARNKWLWNPDERTRVVLALDYNRMKNEDGLGFHVVEPGIGADGTTRYNGFYNTYGNPNDSSDVRQTGASIHAEREFAVTNLVGITSWRNVNGQVQLNTDGVPREIIEGVYRQHDRQVTQEMRLISKDGAALPWIAGIYYLNDLAGYQPLRRLGETAAPFEETQTWSAQRSESYSAFGQATPTVASDTHLTLGARYTTDHRSVDGRTLGISDEPVSTLASASKSASWSKLTWRVALDHRFSAGVMGYLSNDRGFKSGIFNLASPAAAPVNPETLDAYQMGLKTQSTDNRFRADLALFYYRYKDLQVQEILTGAINLVNAASAQMKGVDANVFIRPVDTLILQFGMEAMEGHYTDFKNAPFVRPTVDPGGTPIGGNTRTAGDATGNDTVRTPKLTATASVDLRIGVPRGRLDLVVSDYHNSGFAWDPDNRLRQPGYDLVTVSAEWTSPRNAWSVRLWGKNLAGAKICAYETAGTLLDQCSPAPPRTYGITVSTRQ